MILFNIRAEKYASSLLASGVANRWNKKDEFVIYATESISLATLELLVHINSAQLNKKYKLLSIEVDDTCAIEHKTIENLPKDWRSFNAYSKLQHAGSEWYQSCKSIILQIPSVIIQQESNYIINTKHPDFDKKIKLLSSEDFIWDERLFHK